MKEILKVLVGSHAHGLATEESDIDYRGVFVVPTVDLLKIGHGAPKHNSWTEGDKEDDTSYEVAHFLHLATKSNPSILEVFTAPMITMEPEGKRLRDLFPYVWSSKRVVDAFTGYSKNQRKKMLDDKYPFRDRKWKFAVAYLRTLIQGIGLLRTGELCVKIPDKEIDFLRDIKSGKCSIGQIMDYAEMYQTTLYTVYDDSPKQEVNWGPINDFLLDIRQSHWGKE